MLIPFRIPFGTCHSQFLFNDILYDTADLTNLSRICFWHIDDSLYNAEELVSNSEKIVQRAMDRKMSFVDILLLREALKHLYVLAPFFYFQEI